MNFVTHNDKRIERADNSCLQGYIEIKFEDIERVLGIPMCQSSYPEGGDWRRSDAEWIIQWEDGTIAYIYNYKNGQNYGDADGLPTKEITDWHIGGKSGSLAYERTILLFYQECKCSFRSTALRFADLRFERRRDE